MGEFMFAKYLEHCLAYNKYDLSLCRISKNFNETALPLKLKDKKQQHIQTQLGSDLVWCSGEIKKIKKYLNKRKYKIFLI